MKTFFFRTIFFFLHRFKFDAIFGKKLKLEFFIGTAKLFGKILKNTISFPKKQENLCNSKLKAEQ